MKMGNTNEAGRARTSHAGRVPHAPCRLQLLPASSFAAAECQGMTIPKIFSLKQKLTLVGCWFNSVIPLMGANYLPDEKFT